MSGVVNRFIMTRFKKAPALICTFIQVLLICITCSTASYASTFQNCVYPADSAGIGYVSTYVGPLEQNCASECQANCTATFSYITSFGESAADLIQGCIKSCQNGVTYSAYTHVADSQFPLWKLSSSKASVTSSCAALPASGSGTKIISTDNGAYVVTYSNNAISSFYFVVDTGLVIDSISGTYVTVSIAGSLTNAGYMCGSSSSYLWPIDGSKGTNNSAGSGSTIGLESASSWDGTSATDTNLNYWNVRNSNWTALPDATIAPKNGDYLAITYAGNYCQAQSCSMSSNPPSTLPAYGASRTYGYDRGLLMLLSNGSTSYNWPGNSMSIAACSADNAGNISCPTTTSCNSTVDSSGNLSCPPTNSLSASSATFNLNGSYAITQVALNNQASSPSNNIGFSGVLSGFSNSATPLYFKHNDLVSTTQVVASSYDCCDDGWNLSKYACGTLTNPTKTCECCCSKDQSLCIASRRDRDTCYTYDYITNNRFVDNVGGLIVKVDWQGCYFSQTNPSNLQYAVLPKSASNPPVASDYNSLTWNNVTVGSQIKTTKSGKLLLRITPGSAKSLGDVGGGYSLSVRKTPVTVTTAKSGLNTVVEAINAQLFGSSLSSTDISSALADAAASDGSGTYGNIKVGTPGIVQNIFTNLAQGSSFVTAIRALLVFYIAYVGLSFMMGTSQIDQKEALTILAKLGVVLTLISGSGWSFFNTYVFNTLIQGSAELMTMMVMNYDDYNVADTGVKAVNLFSFLDPILAQVFSDTIWIKIAALLCSGLNGWFVALWLIVSIILFVVFIFRVVMIYLTSLIAMAILTIVAPIFISFMLFKYTYDMFLGWLKLYISFALQPVFVVTCAGIMAKLIVYVLNSSLYFSACSVCLLGFKAGGIDVCLFKWFMVIPSLTGPSPGTIEAPVVSIESLMVLYLVINSANILCGHLSNLASEIATGSALALNLAYAAVSNPMAPVDALKTMFGMNNEAKNMRGSMMNLAGNTAGAAKAASGAARNGIVAAYEMGKAGANWLRSEGANAPGGGGDAGGGGGRGAPGGGAPGGGAPGGGAPGGGGDAGGGGGRGAPGAPGAPGGGAPGGGGAPDAPSGSAIGTSAPSGASGEPLAQALQANMPQQANVDAFAARARELQGLPAQDVKTNPPSQEEAVNTAAEKSAVRLEDGIEIRRVPESERKNTLQDLKDAGIRKSYDHVEIVMNMMDSTIQGIERMQDVQKEIKRSMESMTPEFLQENAKELEGMLDNSKKMEQMSRDCLSEYYKLLETKIGDLVEQLPPSAAAGAQNAPATLESAGSPTPISQIREQVLEKLKELSPRFESAMKDNG